MKALRNDDFDSYWTQPSAGGAIGQIKERGYGDWVRGYTGDILLVGIHYDKEKRPMNV
jgi:hypothetical protein